MARLNELPGPAESVEALKRRFVRQNREIARVNSLQSLRIQSLESELSHLLKENAALKEQIISLTQDAEKFAAGRTFHKDIYQCREKLAAKVSELDSLVSELGMIPDNFLKKTAHLGTASVNIERHRSSETGRRPVTWDENGDRLPTILEDKYFPRRTLDPEELVAAQDLDSPTIGSPPIAHFDVDQSPLSLTKHDDFGLSTKDAASPNVDSSNNDNSPSDSPSDINEDIPAPYLSPSPSKSVLVPALSGSKRKFSATEDEISFSPLPATTSSTLDDDFQFTRSVDVSRAQRPTVTVEIIKEQPLGHGKKQQQKKINLAKRRVLEPKSTNMASSPKKVHGAQVNDGKPENMPKRRGEEENTRKTEPARKASQFQPDLAKKAKRATTAMTTTTTHEDEAIKPISSSLAPMEKEHERKESFTTGDVNEPAVVTESMPLPSLASRPSRRARGAISYAEPNLRDKMRRATNELVDAVKLENAQRTSSSLPGNAGKDHEPESHNEYSPDQNDATSNVAAINTAIPHDNQGIVAELPRHMVTERKRRTLSASTNEIARFSKTECELDLKQNPEAQGTRALLSPSSTNNTAQDHPRRRSASLNPQSRRHSSNPAVYDRGKSSQIDKLSNYGASEMGSGCHDNDIILEESQPRKTTITKEIGPSRIRGTRTLVEDGNVQATRGQRASSRRRSTLL